MPLTPGTRLGPYEILGPIGEGGMGEVYKAADIRLDRIVALKVSKTAFSERFEREARMIAALNHPQICQLYDVGSNYLVMELVEGPTLAERIAQGAIPQDESLRIAFQVAGALDYAHEKKVAHRDLKPANIKIRPDGTVKVLDFGLAKALVEEPSSGNETRTIGATEAGAILGTPSYMAPEQARGEKVDKRADIWAFGVVLHEMLTGRRLFAADNSVETMAAVLNQPISWDAVPARSQKLLRKCLERDLSKRLRDMGDIAPLLEEGAVTQAKSKLPWAIAAATALVAAVALWAPWRSTGEEEKPLVRLDVDLGADVSLGSLYGADAIISPDGTRLVYVSKNRLFTRRLNEPKAVELAATQGAAAPFFSPDGQWVAFFGQGQLKKVSVTGGSPIVLCGAPTSRGGSWGQDGSIVAALNTVAALVKIPSGGGAPTSFTELAPGEVTHRWPQILPGGKAVLFTSHTRASGFDAASIEVMTLRDHRRKVLQRGGTYGRYLPSGHLVYLNRGTLFAVPFDLDRLEVRGTPAPILEQIDYSPLYGSAQFDFSQAGTLLYRGGGAGGRMVTIQWLDGAGRTQPLLTKPGLYERPRLSPDGQRISLLKTDDTFTTDNWVYDSQRDTMTRLTSGDGLGYTVWSPDGRFIVLQTGAGMSWTRSDGGGKPQPLVQSKTQQFSWSFTPDGKRLAYYQADPVNGFDIWTVPVENNGAGLKAGKPEPFLQTVSDERFPVFSPDGRWLAYSSTDGGTFQVYVRAFPDRGGKWQISSDGGVVPWWSRGGRELFYRTEDNSRTMVASYTVQGDSFVPGKPRVWSDKPLANLGLVGNYDLAPDGKRIAALMPVETPEAQQEQSHVVFLMNFFDELRRKVPVSGK